MWTCFTEELGYRDSTHTVSTDNVSIEKEIKMKAASSVERALAVHACQGMLLSMHAAVGACSSNTFR